MRGGPKPHWLSFIQDALPVMTKLSGVDWTRAYWDSLEQYKELDYYHFQRLPFAQALETLKERMTELGMSERDVAAQTHVLQEEAYGVMSFHKHECRVIRPTSDAVRAFRHTDVRVPLGDVAAPYPHVYIALPKEQGLQIRGYNDPDKTFDLQGMYVTWAPTGEATKEAAAASAYTVFRRNKWGLIVPASQAGPDDPVVEPSPEMFGDWACRVQAVAWAGPNQKHNYTTTFFNMRWVSTSTEEAEGAYKRFTEHWLPSFEKCPGGQLGSFELNQQLFHLVANIYLYMSQKGEEADTVWMPDRDRERLRTGKRSMSSKRRRRLRQQLLEQMPTDEWVVGQKLKIDKSIEQSDTDEQLGTGKTHASPKTHWRRGHWHGYWTGPREGPRKMVYKMLKPVLIVGLGNKPDYTLISVEKKQK